MENSASQHKNVPNSVEIAVSVVFYKKVRAQRIEQPFCNKDGKGLRTQRMPKRTYHNKETPAHQHIEEQRELRMLAQTADLEDAASNNQQPLNAKHNPAQSATQPTNKDRSIRSGNNLTKEYLSEFPLFNDLMKTCANIYELKKDIYVKKIIVLIKLIKDKINETEFSSKLEKCQKKERDIIKKALDPNINNKPRIRNTTSSEFHNFLKKSKDNLKNKPGKMLQYKTDEKKIFLI